MRCQPSGHTRTKLTIRSVGAACTPSMPSRHNTRLTIKRVWPSTTVPAPACVGMSTDPTSMRGSSTTSRRALLPPGPPSGIRGGDHRPIAEYRSAPVWRLRRRYDRPHNGGCVQIHGAQARYGNSVVLLPRATTHRAWGDCSRLILRACVRRRALRLPRQPAAFVTSFDAGIRESEQMKPLVFDEPPNSGMPRDDRVNHRSRRVDEDGEP